MKDMESFDYWRLCNELSINQAGHLLIGLPPDEIESLEMQGNELSESSQRRYKNNINAARTAISQALRSKSIRGRHVPDNPHDLNGKPCEKVEDTTDIDASTVDVESLRQWLVARGFRTGFFFPLETDAPAYLDPSHARYAPKLAAAVRAWMAVDDPKGKHPKQALTKWLREHAANFGLSDDEGKPNEQGIEECAKVSNWQPGGGAPKTPG